MKRNLISTVLLLLIVSLNLKSQDTNKVYPKIQKVTIYDDQAQLEKSIELSLKKGFNEFVLAGNSVNLNNSTIQFTPNNNYVLIEFTPYVQYVKAEEAAEERLSEDIRKKVNTIKDSIEIINDKLVEVVNFLSVLNKEKKSLEGMRVVTMSSQIDTVSKMRDGLNYFRDKMNEVNLSIHKKEKERSLQNKNLSSLKSRLKLLLQGEVNNRAENREYYIKIVLYSEKNITKTKLNYKYNVNGVNWVPEYDIHFTSNDNTSTINLYSKLNQYTGEDWNDVKIVFSTENPFSYIRLLELQPIYCSQRKKVMNKNEEFSIVDDNQVLENEFNLTSFSTDTIIVEEEEEENVAVFSVVENEEIEEDGIIDEIPPLEELNNRLLSRDYEVAMNYTIKSGGRSKIIPLDKKITNITYKYFSLPTISKDVYLSALFPEWEKLELSSAKAKIFIDNNYINLTDIDASSTKDTLIIPISREKRLAIDRKETISQPLKSSVIGSNYETVYSISVEIKNNTQNIVAIQIEDRIPLTKSEGIKITPNDLAKAVYDEKTGKLTWNLNLNALESKTINFSYTVKHPKGANLSFN